VTAIAADVDFVSAPKNYADLFEQYYMYVVNLCAHFGIDEQNKEDIACEILLRFMERGSLEKFDPDLVFDYRGQVRPARFKSYLSRAVEMYVRGHREKQRKHTRREIQICDVQLGGQDLGMFGEKAGTTWVEQYGEAHEDHADEVLDVINEQAEAETTRRLLALVPRRSPADRCDLVAVFDAARTQILATGTYDIKALKDFFGISSTAMHSWMWWLKANLAVIWGQPVPAKRPRRTRCKNPDCECRDQ
jgi:DNA-directed RNA polymerase specialized sigma24 family protein